MSEPKPPTRRLIWWGRADPDYSRNAVVRAAMRALGWAIHDYAPGKFDTLGLGSPKGLPADAALLWVPCFRQRDMKSAARYAKRHGLPLVFDPLISAFDKQVFERRKFAERSAKAQRLLRWERERFASADMVVADTSAHAAYFHHSFAMPQARLAVVPVGADDQLFVPQPARPTQGRRVQVLFYGSFIDLQGPKVIARAAAMGDGVDWCFLGDGPLRQACEQITAGCGHVRYEPWADYTDLPGRIGQADILLGVFSESAKAGRVVPNKVYQAMACARPVITRAPLPGAFPWGDGGNATEQHGVQTVEPGDPRALASAVQQLADDTDLMHRAGQAARATFERHGSLERVTQAVAEVLERVLAKPQQASGGPR